MAAPCRSILEQAKKKNDYFAKENLKIVELMLDVVTEEFLLRSCQILSQGDYEDITIERSLIERCGYPLCSKELVQVPHQQFKISLKTKCVYDITERKRFCSNMCFKASKYLSKQLSTEPRWVLSNEALPEVEITLLPLDENCGSAGEIIPLVARISLSDVDELAPVAVSENTENVINSCVSSRELQKLAEKTESLNLTITEKIDVSDSFSKKKASDFKKRGKNQPDPIKGDAQSISKSTDNAMCDRIELATVEVSKTGVKETLAPACDNAGQTCVNNRPTEPTANKNVGNVTETYVPFATETEHQLKPESSVVRNRNEIPKTTKEGKTKTAYNSATKPVQRIRETLRQWVTIQTIQYLSGNTQFLMVNDVMEDYASFLDDNISDNEDLGASKNSVTPMLAAQHRDPSQKTVTASEENIPNSSVTLDSVKPTIAEPSKRASSETVTTNESKSESVVSLRENLVEGNLKRAAVSSVNPTSSKSGPQQLKKKIAKKKVVNADGIILPKMDAVSQNLIRRQIVESKFQDVFGDILGPLTSLSSGVMADALKPLVKTFNLAPTNIVFKPAEQLLMGVVLLLMMSRRDEELKRELDASSSEKYLAVLLKGFGISVRQLAEIVSKVLNESESASSSETL